MQAFGTWNETITIDGELFRADTVEDTYAARAGFDRIWAIRGLPSRYTDRIVKAAQVSDVPHTWRVQESPSEEAVPDDVLTRGRENLANDIKCMGVHIVSYFGVRNSNPDHLEFLAAGAIRNKLSRNFESDEFPVVSRAVVAPKFRGCGLGSLIVEHRMKATVRGFFSRPAKAIHFGTESVKVLHSIKKVERDEGIKFVHIGDEQYQTLAGTHHVADFLCFLPAYRRQLLEACDLLEGVDKAQASLLHERMEVFMEQGVEGQLGSELEETFDWFRLSSSDTEPVQSAMNLIDEFFLVKKAIGATDPTHSRS